MPTQVMLDLETLGNRPGCVIVSIGAVTFGAGQIRSSFYERVDAEDCVRHGLTLDASTVLWWMRQSAEARNELSKPGLKLAEALARFSAFVNDPDAGFGATEHRSTTQSFQRHTPALHSRAPGNFGMTAVTGR